MSFLKPKSDFQPFQSALVRQVCTRALVAPKDLAFSTQLRKQLSISEDSNLNKAGL
jgi:hypothetical protein